MRFWETVLLAAVVVTFGLTVFPPRRRWISHVAVATMTGAVVVQAVVEGFRWQLVPVCVVAGGLVLVWAARFRPPAPSPPGWPRRVGRVVAVVVGVLGLVIATATPVLVPVFDFPEPSGPYGIGTVTYHWTDEDRPEEFTADPDDRREVVVQVWYPADPDPDADRAPYVPDSEALAPLAGLAGLPSFTFNHLEYVTTNAVPSAPVADDRPDYPLLVLATGRGGYRQYNTLGVEDLVSHGYVVAGIDHPYSDAGVVLSDGRVAALDDRMLDDGFVERIVPFLAGDATFTLDQMIRVDRADPLGVLTGRIDTGTVGLFGLSLGGEITAQACMTDTRFQACLPIDCWMTPPVVDAGLTQPTLWLTRDMDTMRQEGWTEDEVQRTHRTIRSVYDRLPADGYIVRIPGMYHPDFGDTQLLSPLFRPLGISGPLDGDRAHQLVNDYVRAFFDHHVRGRPAPLLDRPAPNDVLFEHHSPTPRQGR